MRSGSGHYSHGSVRRVSGPLVENSVLTYEGQDRFAVLRRNGRKLNLVPGRTGIGFYRKVGGNLTNTLLYYNYIGSKV